MTTRYSRAGDRGVGWFDTAEFATVCSDEINSGAEPGKTGIRRAWFDAVVGFPGFGAGERFGFFRVDGRS